MEPEDTRTPRRRPFGVATSLAREAADVATGQVDDTRDRHGSPSPAPYRRTILVAGALCALAACGVEQVPVPFDVSESRGCYLNPNWTPPEARRPVPPPGSGFVQLSPIPGESGVSNSSSCLGDGGGGGGGR